MRRILLSVALLAALACQRAAPPPAGAPHVRFTIHDQGSPGLAVEIIDLPAGDLAALAKHPPTAEEWPWLLRVAVAPEDAATNEAAPNLPPVAGRYALTRTALVFTPLFGFDAGRRYRVTFDPSRLPPSNDGAPWRRGPIADIVSRPKPLARPSTFVDRVYPSIDVLPENQLRLYLHFSAPMGRKGGVDYIRLLDQAGREVTHAFLPLDAEFWNGDRTRYTLFFDPGRVKRGILPNEQMGRPLKRGGRYTLEVSSEWIDAQGLPLKDSYRHAFRAGPADVRPIDPARWKLQPPAGGTRDPLVVVFPEPLDHGLLLRALGVATAGGTAVGGRADILDRETRWTLTPNEPWQAGDYRLLVLTILEDLAGNRIGRAFEVDAFDRADRSAEPESISIPFRVLPPP